MEVAGKTLGLIGLGRIGREVARRAQALRMEVIAYDPFVSTQSSEGGLRLVTLDEVIASADFISLHVPLSAETRHMIDAAAMGKMKRGARLINCARGGLIDEAALLEALESGQLAGAALDVFENEPPQDRRLVEHPRVVSTPHLGASTLEAQERVGTEIVEKVLDYLRGGMILDAVNFPSVGREGYATLGPVMGLAERLGSFLGQVAEGRMRRLEVRCLGSFAAQPLRPVVMAAVRGLLAPVLEGGVSYVNALTLAAERGLTVEETRSAEDAAPYAGLLRLTLQTDEGEASVAGTLFAPDRPRLVEVDQVSIESHPAGHMLFVRNRDVPGVVGRIGTILGHNAVNIAGIQLGRARPGAMAVSIIDVDSAVPVAALTEIRQISEVVFVRAIAV
jgi:D-3-phosphoglycerate dehydrogenase